jgi:hypothetical protein
MTRSSSPSSQTMKHYVGGPADLQKQAAEAPGEPEGLRDVALAVPRSGTHKRRTDDGVSMSPVAAEASAYRTGRGLIPSGACDSRATGISTPQLHLSADAAPPDRPIH